MISARILLSGAALAFAGPAWAQSMPGMDHSAKPPKGAQAQTPLPAATDPDCPPEHAAMGHCTPKVAPAPRTAPPAPAPPDSDCPPEHAAMGHCAPRAPEATPPATPSDGAAAGKGTDLNPGNAPAPAPPRDRYADRIFPAAEMVRAHHAMMKESGATRVSFLSFDLAEFTFTNGRDGFRWDGEAWTGGDRDRFVLKYEGEGTLGGEVEDAEFQALYSRAISPYWNLQAGLRYDVKPDPSRAYAVIGIEGLAPYWFELTGAAFLSNKGELRSRLGGYYDQRITQRLILQPRFEANLSAQDIPELDVGSGITDLELGLRLRYEIRKEFAPYAGFSWARQIGQTAGMKRARGEDVSDGRFVMGLRVWF